MRFARAGRIGRSVGKTTPNLPRVKHDDEYPPIDWDGVTAADASAIAELAASFLIDSASKSSLPFERPTIPLDHGGPWASPPGFSGEGWVVLYEGAYNWSIHFPSLIFEDGPLADYCKSHRLFIDVATGSGWSIMLLGDQ